MEINPVSGWFISVGKLNSTHLSDEHGPLVNKSLDGTSSGVLGTIKRVISSVSTTSCDALDMINVFDTETQLSFAVSRYQSLNTFENLRQPEVSEELE